MPEILKEILYDGKKVITEAAKRDSEGNQINITYAKKSDTYTKAEVEGLIGTGGNGAGITFEEVDTLPLHPNYHTIYVINNEQKAYTTDGHWVTIGSVAQQTFKTINGQSILGSGNIVITGNGTGAVGSSISFEKVNSLPNINDANTQVIYLLPKSDIDNAGVTHDYYEEYFVSDGEFELFGTTYDMTNVLSRLSTIENNYMSELNTTIFIQQYLANNHYARLSDVPSTVAELSDGSDVVHTPQMNQAIQTAIVNAGTGRAYFEESTGNLNEYLSTGDYKITTATNYPVGTSANGLLKVDRYSESYGKQEWITSNTLSIRDISVEAQSSFANALTINGTSYQSGEDIRLAAGSSYTISGTYNGRIIIYDPNVGNYGATLNADTTLILNNAKLKSENQVITYQPSNKKLRIVLENGTYNYLINTIEQTSTTRVSDAVIYSENNLAIFGTGGLGILSNTGFHGIKAKEITIGGGNPHIVIKAVHDCIHGSHFVNVQYGVIALYDAHCGIDSSNNENTEGKVIITGGQITVNNCALGMKSCIEGVIANVISRDYLHVTFNNTTTALQNIVMVRDACSSNNQDQAITLANATVTVENYYGTGVVKYMNASSNDVLTDVTFMSGNEEITEFTIDPVNAATLNLTKYGDQLIYAVQPLEDVGATQSSTPVVYISGNIQYPICVMSNSNCRIILDNANIITSASMPPIYTVNEINLKIDCLENTVNYIMNNYDGTLDNDHDYDAVKSEGDLRLNGNGALIVRSQKGDGLDGSDVEFKGDGARYALDCGECGIKGTLLCFGGDYNEGSSNSAYTNIYALHNNTIYGYDGVDYTYSGTSDNRYFPGADVYARSGLKKQSKRYGAYIIFAGYYGYIYTGTFKSVEIAVEKVNPGEGATRYVSSTADHAAIYYTHANTGLEYYWTLKNVSVTDHSNLVGTTLVSSINDDTLDDFMSDNISFSNWTTYVSKDYVDNHVSLPAYPSDTTKDYVIHYRNGQIVWVATDGEVVSEIDALVTSDGYTLVTDDGNTLVLGDPETEVLTSGTLQDIYNPDGE